MEAARLLRGGMRKSEVAKQLQVSPMSVTRWAASLEETGKDGLRRAARLGRKSKLKAPDLRRLKQALIGRQPSGEAWTLPAIAEHIRKVFAVEYHPGHVWRLLKRLGLSMHNTRGRPRRRVAGAEGQMDPVS